MRNVFMGIAASLFVAIMAVSLDASAACDFCDSKFVVKAGEAYDNCVAKHCKPGGGGGGGGGGNVINNGGGVRPPKTGWCPSADNGAGGMGAMVPAGTECKSCDSLGLIESESKCIDKCSLVPVWHSCTTWCPSANGGTGGSILAGEACEACKFGDNGVACLKAAPTPPRDYSDELDAMRVKLTSLQSQVGQPATPIWREWWFWVLVGLGLANLGLGGVVLRKLKKLR